MRTSDQAGRERGQSTVELALLLPLIVLIIGAVLHGATSLAVQLQLESAAREAARAAVVEPEAAAERASSAARVVAGDRIRTVDTDVGDEWISVTITANVVVIPMLGLERTLEADAVMRREDRIG